MTDLQILVACLVVAAFGAGLLLGWWVGFTAPLDDRADIDALARRDRQR